MQHLQDPTPRHSALSRAFVKTIGRLGAWKRVFQPKSPTLIQKVPDPGGTLSAFDLELNASVDDLTIDGGVEEYLKMTTSASAVSVASSLTAVTGAPIQIPSATLITPTVPNQIQKLPPTPESPSVMPRNISSSSTPVKHHLPSPPLSPILKSIPFFNQRPQQSDIAAMTPPSETLTFDRNSVVQRPESFRSSSTDSFGIPLTSDGPLPPTFPGSHAQWQFDVVSIDDLDFSDTSSLPGPPGLRKQRKLPMRRDFEFIRRSDVSSMGIISHESLRDSVNNSTPPEMSPTSSIGAGPLPIQRWQMKSLQQTFEEMSNNSDGKGDVEAALRRLEGQINPKVLQENAEKVDGWLHDLRERMASGDYANSIYSEDEVEGFFDEVDVASSTEIFEAATENACESVIPRTLLSTLPTYQLPTPPGADRSPKGVQSRVEDAVPVEMLTSRMSSVPLLTNHLPLPSGKFAGGTSSRHRSFILGCTAEQLAQHFSMIDRELFMSIKFEELVTGEWLECDPIDVLDWVQYLKDRARWKAESRHSNKTTALAAVRARFNLVVSFVNTEVVLTPPNERPLVISKFIRVAWASYSP